MMIAGHDAILPDESWSRIFSLVQEPSYPVDRTDTASLFRIITVSKKWASLALPHLYRNIYIFEEVPYLDQEDVGYMMPDLASVLLATRPDDPKRTWIRTIEIEIGIWMDELKTAKLKINICNWLTVIFTHSCQLRSVSMSHYPTRLELASMVGLVKSNRHTLVALELTIDDTNAENLRLIPHLETLRDLSLHFGGDPDESDEPMLSSFADYPPLHMPSVVEFHWVCEAIRGDCLSSGALVYLASCKFNPQCAFRLNFSYMRFTPQDSKILEPLFLNHRDNMVFLDIRGNFECPAVFTHTQRVDFWSLPSARLFQIVERLPPIITYHASDESELKVLYSILDTLAKSPGTYNACVQLFITMRKTHRSWLWCPEVTEILSDVDMMTTTKLMQFSRLLKPKGITLADQAGMTLELHQSKDPRLS